MFYAATRKTAASWNSFREEWRLNGSRSRSYNRPTRILIPLGYIFFPLSMDFSSFSPAACERLIRSPLFLFPFSYLAGKFVAGYKTDNSRREFRLERRLYGVEKCRKLKILFHCFPVYLLWTLIHRVLISLAEVKGEKAKSWRKRLRGIYIARARDCADGRGLLKPPISTPSRKCTSIRLSSIALRDYRCRISG